MKHHKILTPLGPAIALLIQDGTEHYTTPADYGLILYGANNADYPSAIEHSKAKWIAIYDRASHVAVVQDSNTTMPLDPADLHLVCPRCQSTDLRAMVLDWYCKDCHKKWRKDLTPLADRPRGRGKPPQLDRPPCPHAKSWDPCKLASNGKNWLCRKGEGRSGCGYSISKRKAKARLDITKGLE